MRNRKGEATGSGLMYFIFLIMVVMIVGGIYGGLIAFFGNGYDYRQSESIALLKNVRECIDREKFDLTKLDKEVFLQKCGLSGSVIEDGKHIIYVKDKNGNELNLGVADFKVRCGLDARFKKKDLPLCSEYQYDSGDYILVGSSQTSRRVAV